MKRNLLSLTLIAVLICSLSVSAFAAAGDVTFTADGKLSDNFDIGEVFRGLEPGDSATYTVNIHNRNKSTTRWYMSNTVLQSLEDGYNISGGAYNTFKLAKKKKLAMINISKETEKQNYERSDIMQTKLIAVTADLLTLSYLSRQPGSAYEITKFIEENSTEGMALSQNAVYTSLYKLAQNGYVKSETATTETGRIREVYSILPEGVAYYQSFLVSYVKQIESVNHLLNIVK